MTNSAQLPPNGSSDWLSLYNQNGYYFPMKIMSPDQAKNYRLQLEAMEVAYKDEPDTRKLAIGHSNSLLPFADEITRLPAVLDAVSAILGPNLLVWNASFFIKEANTKDFISWHQDLTYWGLTESHEVTAWVALTASTPESGCVKFVPGSHTHNIVEHRDTFHKDNLLSRGQEIAVDVNEEDAVDVQLMPGEMSLHHGRVFHGSHANQSGDRRIGLAIRYISTDMQQTTGDKTNAKLVRGVDDRQNFNLTDSPKAILHSEDVSAVMRNIETSKKFLFAGTDKQV
ncbi:MAG: phytanoyl-CoA dioxygenase family protein [Granulosicoccus sp.]